MRFVKILFLIIVSAAFAAFAVANRHEVSLSLFPLPYSLDLPMFLLALSCIALGAAIAGLYMLASYIHRSRELHAARRRIMALENEIGGMKAEQHVAPAQEIRDPRIKRSVWS